MELRAAKGLVDEEIVQLKKANEILKSRVNNTELEFDKLRTLLRARDRQVTMLTEEIERLDEIRKDYMQYMAEIRDINARRDKEREELEARLRAEEQVCQLYNNCSLYYTFRQLTCVLRSGGGSESTVGRAASTVQSHTGDVA